jgi:hypothetical protein
MSGQTARMMVPVVALLAVTGCAHVHRGSAGSASRTETTLDQNGQPVTIAPSASPRGVVHQTVTGEVRKVDRNRGEVTVRTADGKNAKFVLPPLAVATVNKGDRASFDITFTPR